MKTRAPIVAAIALAPLMSLVACDMDRDDEPAPADAESEAYAPGNDDMDHMDRMDDMAEPPGQAAAPTMTGPRPDATAAQDEQEAGTARPTSAEARIEPTEDYEANGRVRFSAEQGMVTIAGTLNGLAPGEHGLHIHENGDCSAPDASSAGGHFNPDGSRHGSPRDDEHHIGDLGNVTADADGEAEVDVDDPEVQLGGPDGIVGKALVVHSGADDFETQPSGDSGDRAGCGVIRAEGGQAGR